MEQLRTGEEVAKKWSAINRKRNWGGGKKEKEERGNNWREMEDSADKQGRMQEKEAEGWRRGFLVGALAPLCSVTSLSGECNEESQQLLRREAGREERERWYERGEGNTRRERRKESRPTSRNFLPFSTVSPLPPPSPPPPPLCSLHPLLSDSLNLSDHFVSLLQLRSALDSLGEFD